MACVRKWRGSWVVDWRDPSGKRSIETVDGGRDSAERRLAEVVSTGKQSASKKLTFKDYGEWWLENCAKGNIKASTYEEYERALKVHLYPLFGSRPLVKINRKMVREMIAAKQKAALSHSTIRNILAPMRGMAVHFPPYAGVEEPLHQLWPPDAERILEILARSSAVTIDGNREALDS